MKKRMKIVDVLASVLLVGVVSTTVLGQVGGPPPTPVGVPCTGFTVYRPVGDPIVVPAWTCPEGSKCVRVLVVDENDNVVDAYGACTVVA